MPTSCAGAPRARANISRCSGGPMTKPVMSESIGAGLKAAREARALSISEVAQQLKFAPRQIEALEQERFDLLPGGTFVRGMLRSYARLVVSEPAHLLEAMAA